MLKVYATPTSKAVRKEQGRAANAGIEGVPAATARNAIRNRRAGGAGGRR